MVFLDCDPYSDWNMWKKLTDAFKNGDARPLIDQCLKNIMWRTSKRNVSTELAIPKPQQIVHNVKMNQLEAKFYSDQHLKCESEFDQTVAKLTRSSNGLKMNLRTLKLVSSIFIFSRASNLSRSNSIAIKLMCRSWNRCENFVEIVLFQQLLKREWKECRCIR